MKKLTIISQIFGIIGVILQIIAFFTREAVDKGMEQLRKCDEFWGQIARLIIPSIEGECVDGLRKVEEVMRLEELLTNVGYSFSLVGAVLIVMTIVSYFRSRR